MAYYYKKDNKGIWVFAYKESESNVNIAEIKKIWDKTRFKIEPSFYYGSMYVSYALGVFLMMATTLIYWLWSNPFSVLHCFLWIVGVVLILNSYINAWSKLIWANFFFKYNSKQEQSED